MTIYNTKFRKRDLLAGALFTVLLFPLAWFALAAVEPLEQMIIEARQ